MLRPYRARIPLGLLSVTFALVLAAVFRVWLFLHFFEVNGDSLLYGELAKNLLQNGSYGQSLASGAVQPTLIRLPGYPLLIAAAFRLFGMENYAGVCWLQIGMDLAGCLLVWDFVRRVAPASLRTGAAHLALWLAALCPFTAIFSVLPLTESPTIFCVSLALWAMARFRSRPGWLNAVSFTFAVTFASLLRPDGALLVLALAPTMLLACRNQLNIRAAARVIVACALLAAAPFALWTARNWHVFHVFQPLAPRSATDPGQDTYPGFERWFSTWSLDFVSTYQVYWNVPLSPLYTSELPPRVFDSPAQQAATGAIIADYNSHGCVLTHALDRRFGILAAERIKARPLRFYILLPVGRMMDMWLRPRIENLPIDLDWWNYARHHNETLFSWLYGALNALLLALALAGLLLRPLLWRPMLAYLLLRSALLLTITAPEARYTIECFPVLFALAGIAGYRLTTWVLLSVLKVNASPGSA